MTIACSNCNKLFEVIKKDKRRKYLFCSFNCYQESRKNHKPDPNCTCGECGNNFYRKPSAIKNGEGKFCSKECKHKNQRLGIEIRGESYSDRHLIRQSSQYKAWRSAAKKLKQNRCEMCGIKDGSICECCVNKIYLQVHHIKPFSTYPDLRFDLENASILCPKCHSGLQK